MLRHICPLFLAFLVVAVNGASAQSVRARDLGIPFDGEPGPLNAITDVAGVEVGHVTLVEGEGALQVGRGPIRTGVTAILPRGSEVTPVFAGWYSLNGNGEMTGTTWVEESGFLEGPVMITNTHSVGVVHDAVIEWMRDRRAYDRLGRRVWWSLPVVAETWDGTLNDINGFHVRKEHAFQALEGATAGPVPEGNVGGGTGMICHRFKGGIGTSSRRIGSHTVGVLVQCNYGGRRGLRIAGVPVGTEITDLMPEYGGAGDAGDAGSIIVVVATDAPLLPHQLKRLARRVPMGIGRVGGIASNGSGDIFVTFSTANEGGWHDSEVTTVEMYPNSRMTPFFEATVAAVEEAIVNAMVTARTMKGINGNRVHAIPHERLQTILERYGRLER
ncbi:MAG: P1 family peptidase [Gemmatimonadota bacterium]|nr:MAG: P1 family peptidase [Gemmatimonadota bacterium]